MKKPDFEIKVRFKGRYRLVVNEGTERERDTGWFDNIVTDIGLDRLAQATSPQVFAWASIGTGTALASASDTSLQAFVADSSTLSLDSQSNLGPSDYLGHMQAHYTYAQGAVVGNMAEVGIGWASGGGSLWSRARIEYGGSPTTLTLISLDQLTVYYELTCTPVTTDISGTVTISSVDYDYQGRLANAASFMAALFSALNSSGVEWGQIIGGGGGSSSLVAKSYQASSTLGAITGEPSGSSETSGSSTVASYTNGTFVRDSTMTLTPSQGNLSGGIGCILLNYTATSMTFQYHFDTPIPKDNTKTLTLTARFSWGR
jgi:hypothetical protein